ncbi:MAG: aldo/keto reductase [Bryobacterales bacterium]|nr:aldo/keto reductase [Bryobacteraceae bacterium]MDW8129049.1 aldo/keto reductase [Bryobacterales bacterium]
MFRLALSATYRPGTGAVRQALDAGVNCLFCFGWDFQMIRAVREMSPARREQCVIVTGAYNYLWTHQDLRKTLERRLRQLRTEYIDIFLFLGVMRPDQFPAALREQLRRLKEDGRVRAVGMSCHDRRFAGQLAAARELDVLMVRYNAAHPGAETEVFPHTGPEGPIILAYTATCWKRLLRRPKSWPREWSVPDAGMCYRFVLSNPAVHVCLTAPSNPEELQENLRAVAQGPLSEEESLFVRAFGEAVRRKARWFI